MRNSQLIKVTIERIRNHDYEALFARGGCFHFALWIHEKFGYPIRGIKEGHVTSTPNHVWCQRPQDEKAIDIRGVYSEEIIIKLANGGKPANACHVSADDVRRIIHSKCYPRALDAVIYKLADWIIKKHSRFDAVRTIDQDVVARCLGDIAEASKKSPSSECGKRN